MEDDWGEWDEGGSEEEELEVEAEELPRYRLGMLSMSMEGEQPSFDARQLLHGDLPLHPGVHGTFNDENGLMDNDKRHEWMKLVQPEEPEEDPGKPDIQGWTYMADYTLHPLTPNHKGSMQYYIHGRIRYDNSIQFGVFNRVVAGAAKRGESVSQIRMAMAGGKPSFSSRQTVHGDLTPPLRLAGKQEAEALLFPSGQLVVAAAPKLIGVWMNMGKAKITLQRGDSSFYRLKTYYGHIWCYWGALLDNVLYLVGVPAYTGGEQGTLVYTSGGHTRREAVKLPPTEDDLRDFFQGGMVSGEEYVAAPRNNFYSAVDLVWGVKKSGSGGLMGSRVKVSDFLEEYGEYSSSVPLCQRSLACLRQPEPGKFVCTQTAHGDRVVDLTLLGYDGGVYATPQGLEERSLGGFSYKWLASGMKGGWPYTSGASGFVCTKTRYDVLGRVQYAAQAFYAGNRGRNYFIRTIGALRPYGYIPDEEDATEMLDAPDVRLRLSNSDDDPGEDRDPPPGGGGGSISGGEDDDPDPSRPDVPDLGDCGIWFVGGDGVDVTAFRDAQAEGVKYNYKVVVTKNITETTRGLYNITARFGTQDGNSYEVIPGGGATLTMWYYLAGDASVITVRNLTSSSRSGSSWSPNSHPESANPFVQTVWRSVTSRAVFPTMYATNNAKPEACNQSNIIRVVETGRTRDFRGSVLVRGENGSLHRETRTGSMRVYEIRLLEGVVRQILKNYPVVKAKTETCRCTPGSVTGTCTGSAGAPSVTFESGQAVPAQAAPSGESEVKGSFKMQVLGRYGEMSATYTVANGCTGWYEGEASNRQSASISGSLVVTAPARDF